MAQIGVSFITPASEVKPEFVIQLASKIEQAGLHSLWINDRIVYDNLEPLSILAAAAGVTRKIKLGTSILLLPLRHPALVAKTLATIDFVSQGRVILGVGLGNRLSDYEAVGVPFEHRGGRTRESIRLMRYLWRGGNVNFVGRFYSATELSIGPRPFGSQSIPIWMGGSADAVLKRVAQDADGYICPTSALAKFSAVWEKITQYALANGRHPSTIHTAGLSYLAIDEDESRAVSMCKAYFEHHYGKVPEHAESQMIIGSSSACAEKMVSLLAKGFDHLILGLIVPDLRQVDLLCDEVLRKIA